MTTANPIPLERGTSLWKDAFHRLQQNKLAIACLFVFLFIALMLGVVLGSLVTWFAQGKHRKQARDEAHEARKWREEAGKQRTRVRPHPRLPPDRMKTL